MKIAIGSDEVHELHEFFISQVEKRGHEVKRFGSLASQKEESWVRVAYEVGLCVVKKECEEGILFCFSATGVTIVANKFPALRAALCRDGQTAKEARIWNHANILALSNRWLTKELILEVLPAWFDTAFDERGQRYLNELKNLEMDIQNLYERTN